MGTYLSTPVVTKGQEEGACLQHQKSSHSRSLAWGVVDMQGWRKTMEDAHVARTDVQLLSSNSTKIKHENAQLFGVFDGHGGAEVARFCAVYIVSVFQKHYKDDEAGKALRESFHALDRMIDNDNRRDELLRLRVMAPPAGEQREATLELEEDAALNNKNNTSEASEKESRQSTEVTPDTTGSPNNDSDKQGSSAKAATTVTDCGESKNLTEKVEEEAVATAPLENSANNSSDDESDADSVEAAGKEEAAETDQDLSSSSEEEDDDEAAKDDELLEKTASKSSTSTQTSPKQESSVKNTRFALDGTTGSKVSGMLQRLLNLKGSSGSVVVDVGQKTDDASSSADHQNTPTSPSTSTAPIYHAKGNDAPTVIQNGHILQCNLPDHAIHAGATAIVAVIIGNVLTVANAGDSRAVICRARGITQALSEDHKPLDATEMSRIRTAGGFVNTFGRVNGNLNLSRSIGDLKYKQNRELSPAEQMITAEPDIVQITLKPDDEFVVLGCDGIWDCLTNEKAVEFVRTRINDKKPTEIGVEMLDTIISSDPRSTQGIGGDNMTVMIIDLQPLKRNYRTSTASSNL